MLVVCSGDSGDSGFVTQSKDMLVSLIGDSNLVVGVNVSVNACMSLLSLRWIRGLSGVYPASRPVTAGIGDGWMLAPCFWGDFCSACACTLCRSEEALAVAQRACKDMAENLQRVTQDKQSFDLKMAAELDDLYRTKINLEERLVELIRYKHLSTGFLLHIYICI